MNTPLHDGWALRAVAGPVPSEVQGRSIPATVPGCATTDLMAAGLVPDPYLDGNEAQHAWVGRTSWLFETSFETAPCPQDERLDLVFEGLDTVAEVTLNGSLLGKTANMHRTYRFDVRPALVEGRNKLEVLFEAPVDAAARLSKAIGPRPCNSTHPFNAIRKMACNYGWDWGPTLPTAGIWRPVYLQRWRTARVAGVRPLVSVDPPRTGPAGPNDEPPPADETSPLVANAKVEIHVAVERAGLGNEALTVEAAIGTAVATRAVGPWPRARCWRSPCPQLSSGGQRGTAPSRCTKSRSGCRGQGATGLSRSARGGAASGCVLSSWTRGVTRAGRASASS